MDEHVLNKGSTNNRGMLNWFFATLTALLIVLPVLMFTSPEAHATGTPAGTSIGNQATATYQDNKGNTYGSTSNQVITTVSAVYGLTITPNGTAVAPGQTQQATPGNIVYYSYTLTNNGNAQDTFNIATLFDGGNTFVAQSTKVYYDVNGNGQVDVGDIKIAEDTDNDGVPNTTSVLGPVAADTSVKLIVQYTVPSAATAGQVAAVDITGTSVGDNTKTDTGNFNKTTVTTNAVIVVTKSADVTTIDPGGTITYTFRIRNTGNSNASLIKIRDNIPTNTTYVASSASTNLTTGAFTFYDDVNASAGTGNVIPDGTTAKSFEFNQTSGTLAPANERTLTFQVTVNSNAGTGVIPNFGTFSYNNGASNIAAADSNTVNVTINKKSAALISFSAAPFAGTTTSGTDNTGNTTAPTDATTTAANVAAGTYTYFKNVVTNNGNALDTFNIELSGTTLPAGSLVSFYQLTNATTGSANTSPLLDTNGDSIVDTGSIAAGASVTIVARVFVPANATTGGTGTIKATSTNGGTAKSANNGENLTDTTRNVISGIVQPGTDIRNIIAGTPSNTSVTFTTSANGTTVTYPLNVLNTGGSNDTFNLTASNNPAGTTVQFFKVAAAPTTLGAAGTAGASTVTLTDATNFAPGDTIIINGQTLTVGSKSGNDITFASGQTLFAAVANGSTVGEITTTPITATDQLAANASQNIMAVVTVPAGTSPQTVANLTFTSTSTNNATATDSIVNSLVISAFRDFTLVANRSGSAPAGGVLFYDHTITNTGNTSETFTLSTPAGGVFTYQILDTSGNPLTTTPAITAGNSYTFQMKVIVPAGTATGTVDNQIIRATETTSTVAKDNVDQTTVIEGFISLTKAVDKTTAKPGETLTYTITYTNIGSQDAKLVVINDLIPANTTYVANSMQINSTSKTDGTGDDEAFFTNTAPRGVTFYVGTGATSSQGGTVSPGGTGTVRFQVTVN